MALNTAHFHLFRKVHLISLLVFALLFGLWPHPLFAQEAVQQVLDAINVARAENGLGPLSINPLLNQAAQGHVDDMITNYIYGHYGSDGSTARQRVARTGYSATPWVSENWVSASSPEGAMRWWMGDYIHRVNILTPRWTEIGIGVGTRGSEMIFVTVFSAGGGASSGEATIAETAPPVETPPPPSVKIEQLSVPPEGMDYAVQGGDTLLAIGLRYGLPWESIAAANGLNEQSLLQIGQSLRIPGDGGAVAPAEVNVPTENYVVQPNDTLFSIGAQRGLYWEDVAAVNGFGEFTVLQIGQVIQVPIVEQPEAAVALKTTPIVPARGDAVGPITPEQSPQEIKNYALMKFDPTKPVETLTSESAVISTGVGGPTGEGSPSAAAVNDGAGATSAVLAAYAAQVELPDAPAMDVAAKESAATEFVAVEVTAMAAVEEPLLYEVQPGDTIISIAIKHNLEWGALLELNGLAENSVLQLGQQLRLR